MATFTVRVVRTETYEVEIDVEAESQQAAEKLIQDRLDEGGWDNVFTEDGEYSECYSEVKACKEGDANG